MNKEETELLNEMKENCLNGAKYIDPKSMEKYNLLRKLEDRINELQQENKELHNKIDKAIEYMKPRFMNCIDNDKRYFADVYIQEIYEILKDSDVDE